MAVDEVEEVMVELWVQRVEQWGLHKQRALPAEARRRHYCSAPLALASARVSERGEAEGVSV